MPDGVSTADAPPLQSTSSLSGRWQVCAAALLWSTSGVLVKSPPLQSLPQFDRGPLIACCRAIVAATCLLPFVSWKRLRLRLALLPMVVSFAAMNALFITALTHTTAAATIFLQYTATGWAFLFGAIFLHERLSRSNLVALGCSLIGIGWIVVGHWSSDQFLGTFLALGSGMAYGGVVVSLRFLRDEDPAWLITLNHLVSALVLLPWALTREILPSLDQWEIIAVLGMFQMALPYVLFARGVATVTAQESALLTLMEAVLNPFWVWLFWGEEVDIATWIGGSWILSGLILRYGVFRR
jgi:drug/metabolite transporter (DMT)-like permease